MKNIPNEGIVVFDLQSESVSANDVSEVTRLMSIAYGRDYAEEMGERVLLLFSRIREKGWTQKRFIETAKWIIDNRPYKDWSISDFLNAPLTKLYPYSKYLSELHEKGKALNSEIQWYDVNGTILYGYKKEGELPFMKISSGGFTERSDEEPPKVSAPMPEGLKKMFGVNKSGEERPARTDGVKPLEELLPEVNL